jgi:hypothetical protein
MPGRGRVQAGESTRQAHALTPLFGGFSRQLFRRDSSEKLGEKSVDFCPVISLKNVVGSIY